LNVQALINEGVEEDSFNKNRALYAIQQSYREFVKDTHVLRRTINIPTQYGVSEYHLFKYDGHVISKIYNVSLEKPCDEWVCLKLASICACGCCGDTYSYQDGFLGLCPPPECDGMEMELCVSLFPESSSCLMDERVFELYREYIVHGAIARLLPASQARLFREYYTIGKDTAEADAAAQWSRRNARECFDICSDVGGFTTVMNCVSSLRGELHRAGSDDEDYMIDITPSMVSGDIYTFAIPVAVFAFPIGYYDVDLFDGDLFKRTIRLNLHTSGMAGETTVVNTDCPTNRNIAPNMEIPVVCETAVCPAPCPEPCTVMVDTIDRCEVRLGSTFRRIVEAGADEIRMRRIYESRLQSRISTSKEVEFDAAEESQRIADYYNDLFLSGVSVGGVL